MTVSEQLMRTVEPQWQAMLQHPFLRQTADGSLPAGRFEAWLRQDYLFVREDVGFIGSLLARSPVHLRRMLGEFIPALHQEMDLFESMAKELGANLEDIEPSPICHAYQMFLLATAHTRSFTESFAVLYGSEKAYYDSWTQVKKLQTLKSPYQRFIDHWSSDAFAAWVNQLAQALDNLTSGCGADELKRMEDLLRLTARYEYLFWDMALTGAGWPL
jgi:thiaminase